MLAFEFSEEQPSILCLAAHCDDVEIGCGGALLHFIERRSDLHIDIEILCSDEQRGNESQNAARELLSGAGSWNLNLQSFPDGRLPYCGLEIKEYFAALGARYSPDLVITHYRRDLHQDHRMIGELTWQTFRNHPILEMEIPKFDGGLDPPNTYIPLSLELVEKKLDVLSTHFASQQSKTWFKADTFKGLMAIRGVECRSDSGFAEAFHGAKTIIT
ncbi:MAG: PIG-L deacetylase family protein [Pseudomonadota bacterium]